jgi:hypothetical protein
MAEAPKTPVLDLFNRTDGAPGAMWAAGPLEGASGQALNIVSNVLRAPTSGSARSGYWTPSTPGPDCEVHGQAAGAGAGFISLAGLALRLNTIGASSTNGYLAYAQYDDGTFTATYSLNRIDAGVFTELSNGVGFGNTWSLILRATGSSLQFFDLLAGDTPVVTATDSSYGSVGRIGVYQGAFGNNTIENFGGGTLPSTAYPRTAIVDDFTRANSADGGTSWDAFNSGTEIPIASNAFAVTTDSTTRQSYWNADAAIGPDCEVWTNSISGLTWDTDHVEFFMRLAGSTPDEGYSVKWTYLPGSTSSYQILRYDASVGTQLTIDSLGLLDAFLGGECQGDSIRVYTGNGLGTGVTLINESVDATYSGAGFIAVKLLKAAFGA